jgi:2-oxoglutarate ferredoxin oxidoreductase subunit beta
VYSEWTAKEVKDESFLRVEHGKPMIFGKDRNKGIVQRGFKLEVVEIGKDGITENDLVVHDAHEPDITLHMMLVNLQMPMVTGVIRAVESETFEERMRLQVQHVRETTQFKTVDDLLSSGETWEIK